MLLDSCRGYYYWTGFNFNQEHVFKLADTSESVLLWFSRRYNCWFVTSKVVGESGKPEEWDQVRTWARITAKDQFFDHSGFVVPHELFCPWDSSEPSTAFVLKSLDGYFYSSMGAQQNKVEKLMGNIRDAVKTLEDRDEEIKQLKKLLLEKEGQDEELKGLKRELAEKEKAEEQKKPKQEQEPSAEPQQEPPTTSANKMGRASCWTSHGDVSGYLKSGMLGFEQSTILEAQLKCTKLN